MLVKFIAKVNTFPFGRTITKWSELWSLRGFEIQINEKICQVYEPIKSIAKTTNKR